MFISTRGGAPAASLSQAIAAGLAPDGGLYVPQTLPPARTLIAGAGLADTATALLQPFFEGDALAAELSAICAEAFDFRRHWWPWVRRAITRWSCFMAPPPHSRISVRVSWRPA